MSSTQQDPSHGRRFTTLNLLQAIHTSLWSAFWIPAALAARVITRGTRTPLTMARRCWAPGLLKPWGIRIEVAGLEQVDLTRPCFFASNHQSMLDVPVLYRVLPVLRPKI